MTTIAETNFWDIDEAFETSSDQVTRDLVSEDLIDTLEIEELFEDKPSFVETKNSKSKRKRWLKVWKKLPPVTIVMDGTTESFLAAWKKLHDLLFSFAMKLTRNKEDATDLMQETAARAYANLHRFEPWTHFKSWISTIMRNAFINNYRKNKTRNTIQKPIAVIQNEVLNKASRNTVFPDIMHSELLTLVDELEDGYKVPFTLFVDGYHYDEIAEHLNMPIGTVKSRIFYARKQLRELILHRYAGNPLLND